ncbi:GUN4 domain-containing protein [Oscillatoriales cyanobacterium LEGE 11467]|uniref:GUN4 domain-containing protein n=1 Tax=Zarconia navalis LEGE 11467 TaxID=1828826 RepID=A0A928VX13_9CYAN|nr:GUN4 domain-containing protein [Zarconia navalis]MBE9040848.1 GUN4 domain-containing protein [Zarconia navalis LEGE 11467]
MSEIVVDRKYKRLCEFLNDRDFKNADRETHRILLQECHAVHRGWLDKISLFYIADIDLVIIDRLWENHSRKRFGLSTQTKIFKGIASNHTDYSDEKYLHFSMLVGWWIPDEYPVGESLFSLNLSKLLDDERGVWLEYSDLNFSINAPKGHFPVAQDSEVLFSLISKLEKIYYLQQNTTQITLKYLF